MFNHRLLYSFPNLYSIQLLYLIINHIKVSYIIFLFKQSVKPFFTRRSYISSFHACVSSLTATIGSPLYTTRSPYAAAQSSLPTRHQHQEEGEQGYGTSIPRMCSRSLVFIALTPFFCRLLWDGSSGCAYVYSPIRSAAHLPFQPTSSTNPSARPQTT